MQEMNYVMMSSDLDLDVELLSCLYGVAVKVHYDVKSAPTHGCIGNTNQENAEDIVPKSLFILVSPLCTGSQEEENSCYGPENLSVKYLPRYSICGVQGTSKHLGLGLTVRQATRSKELVQLLHSAGHSISYETVLSMDNSSANDVLVRYKENVNAFVPQNFTECTVSYTRYAVGTFRWKGDDEFPMDIRVIPKSDRRLDLGVPQLH